MNIHTVAESFLALMDTSRGGSKPVFVGHVLNRERFEVHEERRERRARERREQLAAIKATAPRVLAPSS